MVIFYNLSIWLVTILIKLASPFNAKAKLFVAGRRKIIKKTQQLFAGNTSKVVWFHCASLGEFEQGRPVIEALKSEFPTVKVLLTFFSPSGYEVKKNYEGADYILYLPWDTRYNAKKFIETTKPVLAIFVKYEFWYHYTHVLKDRGIPVISISSIFRPDQFFFHFLGGFYRGILKQFTYFFVQNDSSVKLLHSIGIQHCEQAGDTRFDRVYQIVNQAKEIPIAKRFKAGQKVFVAGSCWSEDMEVLIPMINDQRLKFIIAPHEISETFISSIEQSLMVKSIRYSQAEGKDLEDYSVLIIDNIGLLSRLYGYGEFAYIGGAFGKGLHNILEAACYGVPILFGNRNFQKFQEATDLINRGGAFEVGDYTDLKT
ncbi:MAG TPA: glycosyltransferase N-terminal domain-containing protein, partial [Ohtaekwangia sp.]|nr:glycosyltransferase N-terminal domain-containing protein [Ohtaekwangia sp.]